jgi:hypothetical protein
MVGVLIVGLIAGGLFANGLPHFIKGITGEKHPTPFGNPGSAVQNVVWGWLNMAVAVLVWHLASMRTHPRATFVSVAVGMLVVGVSLADTWAKRER